MKRPDQRKKTDLYAPIHHGVIDSPAFADLSAQGVRMLLIVARQWTPETNGKLQATHAFASTRGIGSNTTTAKAVRELLAHGFLYRTRSHGIDAATGKNRPALYAITWKPVKLNPKPADVSLSGFVLDAYKKWTPEKNSGAQIVNTGHIKNCTFSPKNRQRKPPLENALSATEGASTESAETKHYEILAITKDISEGLADSKTTPGRKVLSFRPCAKPINYFVYKNSPAFAA